jgi:hypothetical protein
MGIEDQNTHLPAICEIETYHVYLLYFARRWWAYVALYNSIQLRYPWAVSSEVVKDVPCLARDLTVFHRRGVMLRLAEQRQLESVRVLQEEEGQYRQTSGEC